MYKQLIHWSEDQYSYLPWRKNRTRYTTLVSEIMLQQTTVSTVLNHFPRFIEKYPTLSDLAATSEEQILIDWKGLGYYRRARNLLGAAKEIEVKFNGVIPLDYDKLTSIKGIGTYTANAILSIGENKRALSVDANLERVLSRIYGVDKYKGPELQKEIYRLFEMQEICNEIDDYGARVLNEALMDLGRSLCKARSVSCEICPLRQSCIAAKSSSQLKYPREKENAVKVKFFELSLLRVIIQTDSKILAYKKNKSEWLSGQYEIPTFVINSEDTSLKQYPFVSEVIEFEFLNSFKTSITKYKIKNYVIHVNEDDLKKLKIKMNDFVWIDNYDHLSTASHKALLT
jgi:A/G-specific adenine glycosylase